MAQINLGGQSIDIPDQIYNDYLDKYKSGQLSLEQAGQAMYGAAQQAVPAAYRDPQGYPIGPYSYLAYSYHDLAKPYLENVIKTGQQVTSYQPGSLQNGPGVLNNSSVSNSSQSTPQADPALAPSYANGQLVSGGNASTPSQIVGSDTGSPQTTSGSSPALPPQFQQLYDQLDQYLQRLQQNGQVLNPNVQIDPTKVSEFLNQAHTEIDPYYHGQLKLAQDSLSSSLGYNANQETNSENQAERDYGDNLRTLGEQSADQGFAQSGIRQRKEGDLAYNTNQAIQQNRDQLSYNSANAARSFAQQYGTSSLPTSSIGAAPTAVAGQSSFSRQAGSLPLYQLSPEVYDGLVGSQQYQQTADVANRASQLEGAYRTTQGISQARTLNL